ncbi:MAG: hypothetical protein Ct9H300mP1_31400 [Planctomycetaceae bacterium]|nr:MAG: hypothetical protein Ct9H300mP1_31400 [Planctomycetaceae bacterium]
MPVTWRVLSRLPPRAIAWWWRSTVTRVSAGLIRPGTTKHSPKGQRAAMLAALEVVDFVVIFDEGTPEALIEALRPDVLVKGGTYAVKDIVGGELVTSYGVRSSRWALGPGLSTTEILSRIPPGPIGDVAEGWVTSLTSRTLCVGDGMKIAVFCPTGSVMP